MIDLSAMGSQSCTLPPASSLGPWLLALAPAILTAIVAVSSLEWERLLTRNEAALEWLQDLLLHGAFYGAALATLFGLQACIPGWAAASFVCVFGAVCLGASWACAWQRHEGMKGHGHAAPKV